MRWRFSKAPGRTWGPDRSGRCSAKWGSARGTAATPLHDVTEHLIDEGDSFYGLYDVTHYENRAMGESFGNALFVRQA